MNTILLTQNETSKIDTVTLTDHRFNHIKKVLRAEVSDELSFGIIGDKLCKGTLTTITDTEVSFQLHSFSAPPQSLPATIICALPRPQMFRRILHMLTVTGVKEIHFIHTKRVEKSFWQSQVIKADSLETIINEGLSQTIDTIPPTLHFHQRFKPFVEDILPQLMTNSKTILFHPGGDSKFEPQKGENYLLIIGPEGGFIPYEVEKIEEAGAETATMGNRILQVEQAISAISGHLLLSLV